MRLRVLDLDGAIARQATLMEHYQPTLHHLKAWGRRIRLGCSHSRFHAFERTLTAELGNEVPGEPALTLCGSGDFHHVSLALVRRLAGPVNLLVLDNHPDWMRGIPFLHCGTWLYHAARLPQVRHIFHVGGNVDFDNGFRRLAPWPLLRSGKIIVFPAIRYFEGRSWKRVPHEPVRSRPLGRMSPGRMRGLLSSFRELLAECPLYISLDKDVLISAESAVNWDSGHLLLSDVVDVLESFVEAAHGDVAGMDVVGDWSPVKLRGMFRRFLHWSEHPRLNIDPSAVNHRNEWANLFLLDALSRLDLGLTTPAAVSSAP